MRVSAEAISSLVSHWRLRKVFRNLFCPMRHIGTERADVSLVIASINPQLPYDPNNHLWRQLRQTTPEVYLRQGLLVGTLENICDTACASSIGGRYDHFPERMGSSRYLSRKL